MADFYLVYFKIEDKSKDRRKEEVFTREYGVEEKNLSQSLFKEENAL